MTTLNTCQVRPRPFYTLLFAGVLFAITGNAAVLALCLVMPLLAKAFAIWR